MTMVNHGLLTMVAHGMLTMVNHSFVHGWPWPFNKNVKTMVVYGY